MGKSSSSDTTERWMMIIQLTPTHTRGITVREMIHKLVDEGFSIKDDANGRRMVQRDFERLSDQFALSETVDGRTKYWRKLNEKELSSESIQMSDALSLVMAEDMMKKSLPPAMMQAMESRFVAARNKLNTLSKANYANWYKKVRFLPQVMEFQAPSVRPKVLELVQEALLSEKQIEVKYSGMQSKSKTLTLQPYFLIYRGNIGYLVSRTFKYENIIPYALHRIKEVAILDEKVDMEGSPKVDEYIASGAMKFWKGEMISFKAILDDYMAVVLQESKLSEDQEFDWKTNTITATVQDSFEFQSWILSQGIAVEVLEPEYLRDVIATRLKESLAQYE
jgi:predicted DNA-binding transcriptional regulator YafY